MGSFIICLLVLTVVVLVGFVKEGLKTLKESPIRGIVYFVGCLIVCILISIV